jgi:hypothetical protein
MSFSAEEIRAFSRLSFGSRERVKKVPESSSSSKNGLSFTGSVEPLQLLIGGVSTKTQHENRTEAHLSVRVRVS